MPTSAKRIKEPPCIIGLNNIAKHMQWTLKRVLWQAEHYGFPIRLRLYGRKTWILYIRDLERWQLAEQRASRVYLANMPGYHARNYSRGKRDRLKDHVLVLDRDRQLDSKSRCRTCNRSKDAHTIGSLAESRCEARRQQTHLYGI